MNKKLIALLLVCVLLLCVGCKKDDTDPSETASPTDSQMGTEEVTEGNEMLETVPGTAINVFSPDDFEDDETVDGNSGNTAGNTGSSGGAGSSGNNGGAGNASNGGSGTSGNGGQSNTGGNNGGSTGSSGNGNGNSGSSQGGSNSGSNTEKPTEPKPTEPKPTEPKPTQPGATEPEDNITYVSYEEYNNMTPEEQVAYYNQFPSMEAFVQWYNEAKAEYDRENGGIEIEDGSIDLGDIAKP